MSWMDPERFLLLPHRRNACAVAVFLCLSCSGAGTPPADSVASSRDGGGGASDIERRCRLELEARSTAEGPGSPVDSDIAPPAGAIDFADISAWTDAVFDEGADRYFSALGETEIRLRSGLRRDGRSVGELRDEYHVRYCASLREFSRPERELLSFVVGRVQPFLEDQYPVVAQLPWRFARTDSSIEDGLPHTIGGLIVLPERFIDFLMSRTKALGRDEALYEVGYWLLHEKLHVVQRFNRALFRQLYEGAWGFTFVSDLSSGEWLDERRLTNPDAGPGYWLFRAGEGEEARWIWPTMIVIEADGPGSSLHPPSLERAMRQIAVDLRFEKEGPIVRVGSDGEPEHAEPMTVRKFGLRFPFGVAFSHPDEIAAHAFAQIAVEDLRHGEAAFSSAPQSKRWQIVDLRRRFQSTLGEAVSEQ